MAWTPKQLTREQMTDKRQEGERLLEAGKMRQAEIARQLGVSEAARSRKSAGSPSDRTAAGFEPER